MLWRLIYIYILYGILQHHLMCDATDTVDKRFFLDDLEIKKESMEALVAVGSIDAQEV